MGGIVFEAQAFPFRLGGVAFPLQHVAEISLRVQRQDGSKNGCRIKSTFFECNVHTQAGQRVQLADLRRLERDCAVLQQLCTRRLRQSCGRTRDTPPHAAHHPLDRW